MGIAGSRDLEAARLVSTHLGTIFILQRDGIQRM
ncbi:MAG: hypothetical protein VKN72_26020 [Nostocales cyanobacterium 94392]|nr:hypothetical protein [Nostocales cyanobacterium 94392]